jgi:hypothetical protein
LAFFFGTNLEYWVAFNLLPLPSLLKNLIYSRLNSLIICSGSKLNF